jgi:hypothetical protein
MNENEVVELMKTSKNEKEWNANADQVRAACGGGYPNFWFRAIVMSGLMHEVSARWGGTDEMKIEVFP